MKRPKFAPEVKLADLTAEDVICPDCGYNLRGLDGGRCPECGLEFTVEGVRGSQIPWARRKSIGFVRAYVGTVRMHPRRMLFEICRSQDLAEAKRFQRCVMVQLVASLAVYACEFVLFCRAYAIGSVAYKYPAMLGVSLLAVSICLALAPLMATGRALAVGSSLQARAIVVYASSRLVNIVVPAGLSAISCLLGLFFGEYGSGLLGLGIAISPIISLLIFNDWMQRASALIEGLNCSTWMTKRLHSYALGGVFIMLMMSGWAIVSYLFGD